jgi:methyl-accepting chemotaxis protein
MLDSTPVEMRDAAPSETPARASSVGTKLSVFAGLVMVTGLVVLVATSTWSAREALIANEERSFTAITEVLAANVAGGVRWNKPDIVAKAYSRFTEDPTSSIASIRTWNKTGAEVTAFDSDHEAPVDLAAALTQSLEIEGGEFTSRNTSHVVVAVPAGFDKEGNRVGTLAIAWSLRSINDAVMASLLNKGLIALAVMMVAVGVLVVLSRRLVSTPIARLTAVMSELSEGRTDVDLGDEHRRDELGTLARAMKVWRQRILDRQKLELEQQRSRKAVAQQNDRREDLIKLFDEQVREVLTNFDSSTTVLDETAQSMSLVSRETNSQASAVSAAADEASTNVASLAVTAEELSGSISEIARQVQDATQVSDQAVLDVNRTDEAMRSLDEVAQRVGEVVKMIADIAEQTNLLALNATIEAARAGESGRGFAVVANEVKNLANQTAAATDEVGQQISAIQSAASDAVRSISGVTSTIEKVKEINGRIAEAVQQQTNSTNEISDTVQHTARGAKEVSQVIAGVTEGAGKTDSAAQAVLDSGSVLTGEATRLRSSVESFLAEIRAVNESSQAQATA